MRDNSLLRLILLFMIAITTNVEATDKEKDDNCTQVKRRYQTDSLYVDAKGKVTVPIMKLLSLSGVGVLNDSIKSEKEWPKVKIFLENYNLDQVVPVVQGQVDPSISWRGDPTKERWEDDSRKMNFSAACARRIIDIHLTSLHQGEKLNPQSTPKAILFLGGVLPRVRLGMAHLNELYNTGAIAPTLPIYILTGDRKLDEKSGESVDNLMNPDNGIVSFRKDWQPTENSILDEGAMVDLVFSQSRHLQLNKDSIFSTYSTKGAERRVTRENTVKQWLTKYSLDAGSYVAISTQPYVFHQECVIRRVLLQNGRSDIDVEVVGPEMKINLVDDNEAIKQAKNLLNNTSHILWELLEIKTQEANKRCN